MNQQRIQRLSGGVPEHAEKSKYEIVEDLMRQGKSFKEIVEITGFKSSLVSQYRYKIKQNMKSEMTVFPLGHNADRKKCKTCQYRNSGKNYGCNYALLMKHSRGCKVEDCNVYVKGERLYLSDDMQEEEYDE